MATITKYTTRKGTFYKVQGYLGTNPITGLPVNKEKRGFKSKKVYCTPKVRHEKSNFWGVFL